MAMTGAVLPAVDGRRLIRRAAAGRRQDAWFAHATRAFAALVLILLVAIVVALGYAAWPALSKFGAGFFATNVWNPVTGEFGALAPIYGTLATSAIALLIGVPVSFGIAVFLTQMCPAALKRPLGIAVELLAAIPSIIYGMWGLFVFAPFFAVHVEPLIVDTLGRAWLIGPLFQGAPTGLGVLTAGIILAVMVIPFIAAVMRDVFEIVPAVLKESAYAIGCTTWEVVRNIVLPYARTGVVGGIMLGLGRALGETMAVTMVIGNTNRITGSILSPGATMASIIANEFTEATGDLYLSALIEIALVLFAITIVVNALARILVRWTTGGRREIAG